MLDAWNQRTLPFTLDELRVMQRLAREAILNAETGIKRYSLRRIIETTTKVIENSQGNRQHDLPFVEKKCSIAQNIHTAVSFEVPTTGRF